eukprot:8688906-Pyramimonas_sp.AAC.1
MYNHTPLEKSRFAFGVFSRMNAGLMSGACWVVIAAQDPFPLPKTANELVVLRDEEGVVVMAADSESRAVPLAPGLPQCCSNVAGRSLSIAPGPTVSGAESLSSSA